MNKEEYLKLYARLRRIERLLKSAQNPIIPLKKAVRYTGFSKSYLYKLTSDQRIPHYKPNGKMVYFLKKDLDTYLLQNRISTKEEIENKATKYLSTFK